MKTTDGPYKNVQYTHAPLDSPVAVVEGTDKFEALDEALGRSDFFGFLERKRREIGVERGELRIAVKPNLMMFVSRRELDVVTDPELMEHLRERMAGEGYGRVSFIESQNVYSNWYENRRVAQVAEAAGYRSPFVDLTEAAPVEYDSPFIGRHRISSALYDFDVLVSFAKAKSHVSSLVTLGIKNLFGLTWEQDKYARYHGRWGASWNHALLAVATNPELPYVRHGAIFTIVDAWTTLDGLLGLKSAMWEIPNPCRFMGYGSLGGTPIPLPKVVRLNLAARRDTNTILAGEDLMRVERVAMLKMGADGWARTANFPYRLLSRVFGEPVLDRIPVVGGERNAGRELERFDRPERRFHPIGYSSIVKTRAFDVFIPWLAKVLEKLYIPINLVSCYSPADQAVFPKKSYWRFFGGERFRIALPGGHMLFMLGQAARNWLRNLRLLRRRATWRNILFSFSPTGRRKKALPENAAGSAENPSEEKNDGQAA